MRDLASSRRIAGALLAVALLAGCGEDQEPVWPPFVDIGAELPGVFRGSLAWGDYDNDGDLDLAIAGYVAIDDYITRVYRNDGDSTFIAIGAGMVGVAFCSLAWGDYDRDGDLDLALAGDSGPFGVSKVYRNDGGDTFTEVAALIGVDRCSLAWGDYDNDGDLDLALAGYFDVDTKVSRIYRNDGGAVFTNIVAGLTAVDTGSLSWADYDNDGDLDLALAGYVASGNLIAKVYRNGGGGAFTDSAVGLTGVEGCSLAWGDYDNDGDLDLVLAGASLLDGAFADVYQAEGGGLAELSAGLVGVWVCSVAWGDYDNDGDLDLALTGETGILAPISKVYRNDGAVGLVDIAAGIAQIESSSIAWGDYDGDGDLDLALKGEDDTGGYVTKIYRNQCQMPNSVPEPPCALASSVLGADVILSWNAAFDEETPTPGLSYNLRVWPESGTEDVMPGMADPVTGYRCIPDLGNAQKRLFWILKGLSSGTYYGTVQAIDSAYAGGPWAPEQTVTVP